MKTNKVLLVESNISSSLQLKHQLEFLGYDVKEIVDSTEEAFKVINECDPDFIIMDLNISKDIHEINIASMLVDTKKLPIIFTVNKFNDKDITEALENNPYGFLFKPISKENLYTTMETARIRLEKEIELDNIKDKYNDIINNVNDIIFVLNTSGIIQNVNNAITYNLGYTKKDIIYKNFSEFIHEDDLPGVNASFKKTLVGDLEPHEFRIKTKNGDYKYVRSFSSPNRNEFGDITGITGVVVNVDYYKKSEFNYLKKDNEKSVALDSINDMIIIVDINHTVIWQNKSAKNEFSNLVGSQFNNVFNSDYYSKKPAYIDFNKGAYHIIQNKKTSDMFSMRAVVVYNPENEEITSVVKIINKVL